VRHEIETELLISNYSNAICAAPAGLVRLFWANRAPALPLSHRVVQVVVAALRIWVAWAFDFFLLFPSESTVGGICMSN
jgi:hypothetical protein